MSKLQQKPHTSLPAATKLAAAEAKLAAYEAPVGDGRVDDLLKRLQAYRIGHAADWLDDDQLCEDVPAGIIREVEEALCRLSATIAQRERENTKLREALDARVATVIGAVSYLNIGLTSDQRRAVAASIRTVLASSSLAKEKSEPAALSGEEGA